MVESKVRGDDKVIPSMVELCKKRTAGVEDFEYMIGHTGIKQAEDLRRACKKAFGQEPLTLFELGGVVSANTGPDTIAIAYTASGAESSHGKHPAGRRTAQSPARAVFRPAGSLPKTPVCAILFCGALCATSNPNSVTKSNLGF